MDVSGKDYIGAADGDIYGSLPGSQGRHWKRFL